MSFRKIFYLTISYIKYWRLLYTKRKQANHLLKKNKPKPLKREIKNKIVKRFKAFGFKNVSTKWHRYYIGITGRIHTDYIPEILFYTKIEPSLNQGMMFPALEDKNLMENFFPASFLPEAIVKNIHGFYYSAGVQISLEDAINECCQHYEFVVKPTIGSEGGKGVEKIELQGMQDKRKYVQELFIKYGMDFIIEKVLKQHADIDKLNPTSINTIRLMSYMRADNVIPLTAVIRIGRAGSFTDNLSQGGIGCGIDEEGVLKSFAVDENGKKFYESDSGITFEGYQIPHYEDVIKTVKEMHKLMPHFRLISWDLIVDDNSVVKMVEFNAIGQGLLLHQLTNGPLFGEYTDEILSLSANYKAIDRLLKYG